MSANQYTYFLGGTQQVIGLSAPVYVQAPTNANFVYFGGVSGGTAWLAPLPQLGSTPTIGTGAIVSQFFQGLLNVQGPTGFWLSATGATATVNFIWGLSAGYGQSRTS